MYNRQSFLALILCYAFNIVNHRSRLESEPFVDIFPITELKNTARQYW